MKEANLTSVLVSREQFSKLFINTTYIFSTLQFLIIFTILVKGNVDSLIDFLIFLGAAENRKSLFF